MDDVVTDDKASCNLVSVEIRCFNGNVKSLDKDSLNGTLVLPKFDWKIHRLLWIGYEKNCDNKKCLIATLSKDIILCILEFFFVYKPRFITMKFDAENTLNHVVKQYFEYLRENEKHLYDELLSLKPCENKDINNIKLGDRIKLAAGPLNTGVARYIGTPHFVNKNEKAIGLELDSWNANACDGTICGKQVFNTSPGRAHFIHCNSYTNIVPSYLREGSYARLQDLKTVPQFNGKVVKVVSWVSEKQKWKCKLLQNKKERKYLGVRSQNLKPILDWQDDKNINVESLKRMPNLGDRVKIRDNRWGTVKYIGLTPFGKTEEIIGLELDQWSPNANDGSSKGVRYLATTDGRGYFVQLNHLIDNVGKIDWTTEVTDNGNRKDDQQSIDPCVDIPSCINIWCQCGCIKSSIDLDDSKWFKIADDYTSRLKLKHLNLNKSNKIYFELYSGWIKP